MLRLLLAVPLALFISYALMTSMALLVDFSGEKAVKNSEQLRFDVFMAESEPESQRKHRVLPDPPKALPQPPRYQEIVTQSKSSDLPEGTAQLFSPDLSSLPNPNIEVSVTELNLSIPAGVSISAGTATASVPVARELGLTQQAMPLRRIEPHYPKRALRRDIEGYVLLSFTIGRDGSPEDIKIEDAQPANIFDREAVKALRRWRYQPMMVDGRATERPGQQVKLEFRIGR